MVAFTLAPPSTLPPVILPVTFKLPSVPTAVILVCVAVIKVPAMLPPTVRLPPVMLPVADTIPAVRKLPLSILAVTLTVAPV